MADQLDNDCRDRLPQDETMTSLPDHQWKFPVLPNNFESDPISLDTELA